MPDVPCPGQARRKAALLSAVRVAKKADGNAAAVEPENGADRFRGDDACAAFFVLPKRSADAERGTHRVFPEFSADCADSELRGNEAQPESSADATAAGNRCPSSKRRFDSWRAGRYAKRAI